MILRDFDMDLPYVIDESRKNMTNEETRQDWDLNWKWKEFNFVLMHRCMMAMISRLMPRIDTEECWKITIQCVEKNPKDGYLIVGGDCEVQVLIDLEKFYNMTSLEKKQHAIAKTREAMEKIKPLFDVNIILDVCDKIVESGYNNTWFWKKSRKKKNLLAQIKTVHEVEAVYIYMVFTDSKTKRTEEHLIITDKPSGRAFVKYYGSLEWIDEKTAKLITKENNEFIVRCETL